MNVNDVLILAFTYKYLTLIEFCGQVASLFCDISASSHSLSCNRLSLSTVNCKPCFHDDETVVFGAMKQQISIGSRPNMRILEL